MTLYKVFYAGSMFLYVVRLAILLYCVMSWFRPRNTLFLWLGSFIRPFVSPFRRLSMWVSSRTNLPLDFSFMFSIIGLTVVERVWWFLYRLLRLVR